MGMDGIGEPALLVPDLLERDSGKEPVMYACVTSFSSARCMHSLMHCVLAAVPRTSWKLSLHRSPAALVQTGMHVRHGL